MAARTVLAVSAGIAASAVVAWGLFHPAPTLRPVTAPAARSAAPSRGEPPLEAVAPPLPEALPPAPPAAAPRPRDDQTVDWMLSVARDRADPRMPADLAERIQGLHAAFERMPEDATWAATVEPLLRAHLESSATPGLVLTSVSCRAAGCEVQAQILLTDGPWQFPLDLLNTRVGEEGSVLSRQLVVEDSAPVHLGDRMGLLVEYRRLSSASR